MKYKIAVFGSARTDLAQNILDLAEETGGEIARTGSILITGAANGISRNAAKGAKKENGFVVGISPTLNEEEKRDYNVDFEFIDHVVHTGLGYKGRNVLSVKESDGIIVINGGFGTLNEITIAEGELKPIVILENSGGCADIIKSIFDKLNPKYPYIYFAKTPKEAVSKILELIRHK